MTALDAHLPDVPVAAHLHVLAEHGPSEMTCKPCGLLMLPLYEKAANGCGLSRWVCFPCWRGVDVTWGVAS